MFDPTPSWWWWRWAGPGLVQCPSWRSVWIIAKVVVVCAYVWVRVTNMAHSIQIGVTPQKVLEVFIASVRQILKTEFQEFNVHLFSSTAWKEELLHNHRAVLKGHLFKERRTHVNLSLFHYCLNITGRDFETTASRNRLLWHWHWRRSGDAYNGVLERSIIYKHWIAEQQKQQQQQAQFWSKANLQANYCWNGSLRCASSDRLDWENGA